jgi:hypothetical protein
MYISSIREPAVPYSPGRRRFDVRKIVALYIEYIWNQLLEDLFVVIIILLGRPPP